jgi:hypothetical protein
MKTKQERKGKKYERLDNISTDKIISGYIYFVMSPISFFFKDLSFQNRFWISIIMLLIGIMNLWVGYDYKKQRDKILDTFKQKVVEK